MSFSLLRALCTRLIEQDSRIGGLMLLDVTGRVAHLLLEIESRDPGQEIRDLPTHQMIAQLVGSTRETVSRTITTMTAKQMIAVNDGRIRIANREELEGAAGHLLRRHLRTPCSGERTIRPRPPAHPG